MKAKILVRNEREIPLVVDAYYIAELFGVSVRTIYKEISLGKIKATRIGRSYRISREEVLRLIRGE